MAVAFLTSAHADSTDEIRRAWLGVNVSAVMPSLQQMIEHDFELESPAGLLIRKVIAGSPAEETGLLKGDVIVRIGDKLLSENKDLAVAIGDRQPGSTVGLTVIRGASLEVKEVFLGTKPSDDGSSPASHEDARSDRSEDSSLVFLDELVSNPRDCLLVSDIIPGRTTAFDLEKAYAAPAAREEGLAPRTEVFVDHQDGIESLLARYAMDGPALKWARVRLINQLSIEAASVMFDLFDSRTLDPGHAFAPDRVSGGRTIHFMRDGVHFFVLDGVVREIWLTLPDIDIERFREDVSPILEAVQKTERENRDSVENATGESPEETSQTQRIRIKDLQVTKIRSGNSGGYRVLMTTELAGFSGEKLTCGVYLVNDNGQHLLALSETLPGDKDENGIYFPHSSQEITGTESSTVIMPIMLDEQNAGRGSSGGRLHIRAVAIVPDRASALLEREYSLPGHRLEQKRPDRSMNIGFSHVQTGTLDREDRSLEGLWLYTPISVDNCKGAKLLGALHLLRTDRSFVQASDARPAYGDQFGRFYTAAPDQVLFSTARWEPFRIFIPYEALALEGGRSYPLYVRFHVKAGGLWGYCAQLIQLRMP